MIGCVLGVPVRRARASGPAVAARVQVLVGALALEDNARLTAGDEREGRAAVISEEDCT